LFAEIETTIRRLINKRLEVCADKEICAYADYRNPLKTAKYDEICQVLGRFSDNCKETFKAEITRVLEDLGKIRMANAVNARDSFAHHEPPLFAFGEVEQSFLDAESLVKAVGVALGVSLDPPAPASTAAAPVCALRPL
jgi:hypothetical protein